LQQIESSTKDWASNAVKITVLSHKHPYTLSHNLAQKLNHCWDRKDSKDKAALATPILPPLWQCLSAAFFTLD